MQPLVSVIMPVYNAERYIADAIQSVVDQTYANWELIVVDDGSTDKTADIVQQLASEEGRIKYLFQENAGVGNARNTSVLKSSGELIAFLDSDDLWLPEKLELQVRVLEATAADLVFTGAYIFREEDSADETRSFPIIHGKFAGEDILDLLLVRNFIPVMSVLMKRLALTDAGRFEEARLYQGCEDYDLWLKLAKDGAVFYGMDEKLVRYRRHPSAMTHKDSNVLKPMLRVVSRYVQGGKLSANQKKQRIRDLYRELIAALLEEGETGQARQYLKELAAWDKSGVVTSIQKMLMSVSPGSFNFVSKHFLYRAEWHLRTLRKNPKELQPHTARGDSQIESSRSAGGR